MAKSPEDKARDGILGVMLRTPHKPHLPPKLKKKAKPGRKTVKKA
jgi:hypothetical protein